MKPKEIQDLLEYIAKSGMAEVSIETEGLKLTVKRLSNASDMVAAMAIQPAPTVLSLPVVSQVATQAVAEKTEAVVPKESNTTNYLTIKSPMIGTFYRSANPESPSFVNIGDEIQAGKTVGIIEAMKLFNEIESEISGRIVKVLVENSSPVEYDQPLFLVEPK